MQRRKVEDPGDRPGQCDQPHGTEGAGGEHDPEGGGGEVLVEVCPLDDRVGQAAAGDDLQDVDEDGGDRHHPELGGSDQPGEHEEHPEAQDDVADGRDRHPARGVERAARHLRAGGEPRLLFGSGGFRKHRRGGAHGRVARRSATSSA